MALYAAVPGGTWTWFSWHPFCMVFAFVSCTFFAVLLKKRGGYANTKVHGYVMAVALTSAAFGYYVIYSNKNILGKIHLTSWHSWIGLFALLSYLSLFLVGLLGLHPDVGLRNKSQDLRAFHKWAARLAIVASWGTSSLAFYGMHASAFDRLAFFLPLLAATAYIL